MTVFVDTSYFVARAMARDQWHKRAVAAAKPGLRYVTSSLVVNETVSLLQARGYTEAAVKFLEAIRASTEIHVIFPDATLQGRAWDLFTSLVGTGANAVDCASFAIMRGSGIRKAFTFDRRFRSAGFETL